MWNIACVMKIIGKISISLIVSFIIMSCSIPSNRYELLNMRTSDSLLFMETPDTLPDGIIDSVYWIPLENSGQKVLYEISKLCVADSFMVIGSLHQGVLQVYSADGRFLYDISRKGQGPEEYLEIAAFTATSTSIYILDNYSHEMSRYSIDEGRFIEKTKVPFVAWDMEAFNDDDFLFTCLRNNPEAQMSMASVDYAVWRTDGKWQINKKYLPVEKEYTEMYGKTRYFTRHGEDIIFHCLKYDGFFIFPSDGEPVFHPIEFSDSLPRDKSLRLKDVNAGQWQFLAETPFVVDGYSVMEISVAGEGAQMFAVDACNEVFGNSETCAKNLPVNIIGVMDNCFIGYINDNYMLYKELVNYGFQEGNSEVEDMLRNGGCCLIVYQMADSNIAK